MMRKGARDGKPGTLKVSYPETSTDSISSELGVKDQYLKLLSELHM